MAEAWGNILIKAPSEITTELLSSEESTSWETMSNLFRSAGIESLKDSHELLTFCEGEEFHNEGIEEKSGFLNITIFGDEWMHAMQPLVKKGAGIEVYGSIYHEYGCNEYYALNGEGKSFYGIVDFEGDEDADESTVVSEWLEYVPKEVQEAFPMVFSKKDDDDEE
jgi:hypothetical protein